MTDFPHFPPPLPPVPPVRRLRRTVRKSEGRKWLGVASGLAPYLGLSVKAIRAAFFFGSLLGGFGLIAYGIAALLIPAEGDIDPLGDRISHGRPERLLAIIGGLAIAGALLLNNGSADLLGVLVLVALGFYLWSTSRGSQPAGPWLAPQPGVGSTWARPTAASVGFAVPPVTDAPSKRGWSLGWGSFAAAALAMVVTATFSNVFTVVLVGVAALGAGLLVSLVSGHRAWGLLLPLLALGALLPPAYWFSSAGVPLGARSGEVRLAAADLNPAMSRQRLATGHMWVDLRSVTAPEAMSFAVGAGQLEFEVPSDVLVTLHARVGAGQVQSTPELQAGTHLELVRDIGPSGAAIHLTIDARVGMGEIKIVTVPAVTGPR